MKSIKLVVNNDLKKLNYDENLASDLIFWAAFGGVVGSKVYHLLENLDQVFQDPIGMIFSGSGLVFLGGLVGGTIAVTIILNKNKEFLQREILKNKDSISIPICLTKETIEKYLTKYDKIIEKKIHKNSEVGIINGLWANSLGCGGIIPIQTLFYPSSTFLQLQWN